MMADGNAKKQPAAQGGGGDGEVVPGHPIDPVTKLPLLVCPNCKDVNFVSFTVRNPESPNLGRRFFKCPRNRPGDPQRCRSYYFQEEYELYIRSLDMIHHPGDDAAEQAELDGKKVTEDVSILGDGARSKADVYEAVPAADGGSDMHDDAATSVNGGVEDANLGAVKFQEAKIREQELGVLVFWAKFIAFQVLLLNLLMAALVLYVISR